VSETVAVMAVRVKGEWGMGKRRQKNK